MIKPLTTITGAPRYPVTGFLVSVVTMVGIIVIYEIMHLAVIPQEVIRVTLGFALLAGVIYISFRHGLRPALLSAVIANGYLLYAFSGPGRNIVPIQDMLRGEWVLALLFFLPAIIIKYRCAFNLEPYSGVSVDLVEVFLVN